MPVAEKISDLPTGSALNTGDYIPYVDNSGTPTTRKMTKQSLVASLGSATSGWNSLGAAPASVTPLGNRSYSIVFNAIDLTTFTNPGHRMRFTRTVAAPTQSTSLNGSTQYWSKTTPAAMTFTDDFAVSTWVRVTSYALGAITGRYNGTSGWEFHMNADGTIALQGYNASASNFSQVASYQSLPLNRWVHVAAQLDMSAFTPSTTTSYVMFDGVDVPATVSRGGTSPVALIQAGDLNIGASNATRFFPGKIAQVAIYNAKVTQATLLGSMNQGLAGTETSLISGYSFNGNASDLNTTNANNLTAVSGATAIDASSPFGGQASGSVSSTLDYGIIQKITFSTNSTVIVQAPEGCTIPTSGSVSSVDYATVKAPLGMPTQKGKWQLLALLRIAQSQATPGVGTWYNIGSYQLNIPSGEWDAWYLADVSISAGAGQNLSIATTLSTANNSESDGNWSTYVASQNNNILLEQTTTQRNPISLATAAIYYLNLKTLNASVSALTVANGALSTKIVAENAYL